MIDAAITGRFWSHVTKIHQGFWKIHSTAKAVGFLAIWVLGMPSQCYAVNPQPSASGISSVTTAATHLVFTQLPNIACDEVYFFTSPQNLALAYSISPGNNFVMLTVSQTTATAFIAIPTNGNANNLFIATARADDAIAVGFLWKRGT
jgi:hypothetical protein